MPSSNLSMQIPTCAPRLGAVSPSPNVPFRQPLCVDTTQAPPQQMFRTQHSRLTLRNFQNKPSGKEKQQSLCKLFPSSSTVLLPHTHSLTHSPPSLKVTGKDLGGQRAECQSRERKEHVTEEMFPARLQLFLSNMARGSTTSSSQAPAAAGAPPGLGRQALHVFFQ